VNCLSMFSAVIAILVLLGQTPNSSEPKGRNTAQEADVGKAMQALCHTADERFQLEGYESGGIFTLQHFSHTEGRARLRSFLWEHWHGRQRGYAKAEVGTVDAGTVKMLYIIHPDEQGQWGIDVRVQRQIQQPHCSTFHANSLVRVSVRKGAPDYPAQTLSLWLPNGLPKTILKDDLVVNPNSYRVILEANNRAIGDTI
jgi:hypothetical protein